MTHRIGLLGDIHSSLAPLHDALARFRAEAVDCIVCTGDIAGYGGNELEQVVHLLRDAGCKAVAGNHDLAARKRVKGRLREFFMSLPRAIDLEIGNTRIHVVHGEPPAKPWGGIRLLDQRGALIQTRVQEWTRRLEGFDYDILVTGHTHQCFSERLGGMLVINPGSTLFNHSCMILDLPQQQVKLLGVGGRQPVPVWHWGGARQRRPLNEQ